MKMKYIISAAVGSLALAIAPAASAQTESAEAWIDWQEANTQSVSAERMMSGDVTNGFNMLGNVRDLILNPAGTQIQYVLYEVPFPFSFYGAEDGFVAWDNVAIERGVGTDLDLRIDEDESRRAKEQLALTRQQAENRMVSRIVGESMRFPGGAMREITDILFDPTTGMLTDYLVEMDEDSLFEEDMRRIPASMVTLDPSGVLIAAQPVTYTYQVWIY